MGLTTVQRDCAACDNNNNRSAVMFLTDGLAVNPHYHGDTALTQ